MKILFLHGWQSQVGGVKPTYLIEQGNSVSNPHLDDDDFGVALSTAQEEFHRFGPDVIVGSSRGGAIAMQLQSGIVPLVLLCPAWKRWGDQATLKANSLILHSRQDEIIPFSDSESLLALNRLPNENLIEVGRDHRLADPDSLAVMHWACQVLLTRQPFAEDADSMSMAPYDTCGMPDVASYLCDACGEEIVVPLDLTEGSQQTYVEDCPVCCRANIIHVSVDSQGETQVWAEPEQDSDAS